jgi:hypothetical protein
MKGEKMGEKPTAIGQVIRILDEYTVIINAGKDKLKVDDIIKVYSTGEEIEDIDGSVLGYYSFIKDELKVVQVEDNYSICKKDKTTIKSIGSSIALSPMLDSTIAVREPLKVNESEISPIKQKADPFIHIGDPVRLA